MGKFSRQKQAVQRGPIVTTGARIPTHEGGAGYSRDAKSDLFLLAVTNMVRDRTFYESASERDERYEQLIRQVASEDPEWIVGFVPYLRSEMHMRSASLVMAAEYVAGGGPLGRRVIASALQRPDEPAEMLAYWTQTHGRDVPKPVKRGIADAVTRLYTQKAALKYDGVGRTWRMADVLELVHPKPRDHEQSFLFRYLLDARHDREDAIPEELQTIAAATAWAKAPTEELPEGITWERLSGTRKMDAAAWEAVIPTMGFMATLRNLRSFEDAGVDKEVLERVAARIGDPEEVARSKQFPFRFLSAWKATQSMTFGPALEAALDASLANVPALPGRTLILVDVSGSMFDRVSDRSQAGRWELAAIFGAALAKRAERADLVAYSTQIHRVDVSGNASVLRVAERTKDWSGAGGSTNTLGAITTTFDGHDRVVILTDEQAHDAGRGLPDNVKRVFTFNLAGHAPAHLESGVKGRYAFGGLSDKAFTAIELLESVGHDTWPWQRPQ